MQFSRRLFLPAGACLGLAVLSPSPVRAVALEFPAPASATATLNTPLSSYALPVGPWAGGTLPVRTVEGPMTQSAWRIAAPGMTTMQLLDPLRAQIAEAGYRIVWECETEGCGGFDFRFALDVLPEPDMHVDLGDFRFLSAERTGPDGPEALSLLVSRSSETGFVQMVSVGGPAPLPLVVASSGLRPAPEAGPDPAFAPPPEPAAAPSVPAPQDLGKRLETGGSVALEDLVFESGSSRLEAGDFESLASLAAYLKANPQRKVTLVGHTDASGSLAGNTALSRNRALSVRERLVAVYAVSPSQVAAEGAGYLAPRATNLTEAGRARNRRVEVMLTSTQE